MPRVMATFMNKKTQKYILALVAGTYKYEFFINLLIYQLTYSFFRPVFVSLSRTKKSHIISIKQKKIRQNPDTHIFEAHTLQYCNERQNQY